MEKQADEKFCSDCGQVIKLRAEICPKCGVRQIALQAARDGGLEALSSRENEKSKTAAILLCLLLGGLGAHKYYLGQTGAGVLYTLFFWTFIPGLIACIELILLIAMNEKKFHRRFG